MVLAAGVATAALGAPLGIRVPVDPSPATLFRLRAPAGLVRTVVEPIVGPVAEVPGLPGGDALGGHARLGRGPPGCAELVDGTIEPALAGYRLDRF